MTLIRFLSWRGRGASSNDLVNWVSTEYAELRGGRPRGRGMQKGKGEVGESLSLREQHSHAHDLRLTKEFETRSTLTVHTYFQ
jgi:hypothetical protein